MEFDFVRQVFGKMEVVLESNIRGMMYNKICA